MVIRENILYCSRCYYCKNRGKKGQKLDEVFQLFSYSISVALSEAAPTYLSLIRSTGTLHCAAHTKPQGSFFNNPLLNGQSNSFMVLLWCKSGK